MKSHQCVIIKQYAWANISEIKIMYLKVVQLAQKCMHTTSTPGESLSVHRTSKTLNVSINISCCVNYQNFFLELIFWNCSFLVTISTVNGEEKKCILFTLQNNQQCTKFHIHALFQESFFCCTFRNLCCRHVTLMYKSRFDKQTKRTHKNSDFFVKEMSK